MSTSCSGLLAIVIGVPVALPIDLGKAGAAQIVWDGDPLGCGLLRWVMAPKALRQLAGSRCGSCPKL